MKHLGTVWALVLACCSTQSWALADSSQPSQSDDPPAADAAADGSTAGDAPPDVTQERRPPLSAAQLFERAVALANAGQLVEAEKAFQKAHELEPHSLTLYNLGLVRSELGKALEAVDAFERCLVVGEGEMSPEQRADALRRLQKQRAQLARLELRPPVEGAVWSIDGRLSPSAAGGPVLTTAGTHDILLQAPGYRAIRGRVTLARGELRPFTLVPEPALPAIPASGPERPPSVVEPTVVSAPSTEPSVVPPPAAPPMAPLASGGVAEGSEDFAGPLAFAGGAFVCGATALAMRIRTDGRMAEWRARQRIVESLPYFDAELQAQNDGLRRDIQRADSVSLVLGVVGGAASLTSVLWWLLQEPTEEAVTAASWTISPGGISVTGRF